MSLISVTRYNITLCGIYFSQFYPYSKKYKNFHRAISNMLSGDHELIRPILEKTSVIDNIVIWTNQDKDKFVKISFLNLLII